MVTVEGPGFAGVHEHQLAAETRSTSTELVNPGEEPRHLTKNVGLQWGPIWGAAAATKRTDSVAETKMGPDWGPTWRDPI